MSGIISTRPGFFSSSVFTAGGISWKCMGPRLKINQSIEILKSFDNRFKVGVEGRFVASWGQNFADAKRFSQFFACPEYLPGILSRVIVKKIKKNVYKM
jgi:hypothetical protein